MGEVVMKPFITFLVSFFIALVPQFSNAGKSYLGRAPERGVLVIVEPDKSSAKAGDTVEFKGSIKVVGKSKFEEFIDKFKGPHGKKDTLLEEFRKQGLEIHASFPSEAVDVSSQLTLTGVSDEEIHFSFRSSAVKATDLNQFSLKVYNNVKDKGLLKRLTSIQGKLEKRLQLLLSLLKKHQTAKR